MDNNNYAHHIEHTSQLPCTNTTNYTATRLFSVKQFSPVPILEIAVHKLAVRAHGEIAIHTHSWVVVPLSHSKYVLSHLYNTQRTCGEDLIKFSAVIDGADNWTICQGTIKYLPAQVIAAFDFYISIAALIKFWECADVWRFWAAADASTSEMSMINKICTTMLHWKGSSRWLWNYPSISASLSALSRSMQITMVP